MRWPRSWLQELPLAAVKAGSFGKPRDLAVDGAHRGSLRKSFLRGSFPFEAGSQTPALGRLDAPIFVNARFRKRDAPIDRPS